MGINIIPPQKRNAATSRAVEEPCRHCDGSGQVPTASGYRRCECRILRAIRERLGDLRFARRRKSSPLYLGPNGTDHTRDDLFITGAWDDVASHLRTAIALRLWVAAAANDFHFRVVTDEALKAAHFEELGFDTSDDGGTQKTETIRDMMSDRFHLVILRLGFASIRNAALPGIIMEALRHREGRRVPTWVIEDEFAPLREGPCWSPQLGQYLEKRFARVEITPDEEGT